MQGRKAGLGRHHGFQGALHSCWRAAGENGWPVSSILGGRAPENEEEKALLIDTLQDWKTDKYKDIIGEAGGGGRRVLQALPWTLLRML